MNKPPFDHGHTPEFGRPADDADAVHMWHGYRQGLSGGDDCPDVLLLAAYADRQLADGAAREIEAHLAGCAACRSLVVDAALNSVDEAIHHGFASNALRERLYGLAPIGRAAEQTNRPHVMTIRHTLGWVTAAAASMAVAFVGYHAGIDMPAGPAGDVSDSQLIDAMTFGAFQDDDTDLLGFDDSEVAS